MLIKHPFIPDFDNEMITYTLLPALTIIQKYANAKSSEYGIDFELFIIIQSTIVVFTFLVDVYIFDKPMTLVNAIGGLIVVLSAGAALFYY